MKAMYMVMYYVYGGGKPKTLRELGLVETYKINKTVYIIML